jgi:RNA polymerase sigma-70 factor (ECF subfamily)
LDSAIPKPPPDSPALAPAPLVPAAEGVLPAAAAGPALDRATLERVRARDPEAMGRFFETYFDRVYALVFRLLGDRTLAEDAVSDVFLKVHRAADRLDPARDPLPWLVTIATNACRDLWRSGADRMRRRAVDIDDPALAHTLTRGTNDPERDLQAKEREQAVREALAALPEDLRMSVLLYDYAGLSHEAIAERLDITHEAARKRHSRALAALGRSLRERFA